MYTSGSYYNAFNVYCCELAPGTVSLTGHRAQGDDSNHCAYNISIVKVKNLHSPSNPLINL